MDERSASGSRSRGGGQSQCHYVCHASTARGSVEWVPHAVAAPSRPAVRAAYWLVPHGRELPTLWHWGVERSEEDEWNGRGGREVGGLLSAQDDSVELCSSSEYLFRGSTPTSEVYYRQRPRSVNRRRREKVSPQSLLGRSAMTCPRQARAVQSPFEPNGATVKRPRPRGPHSVLLRPTLSDALPEEWTVSLEHTLAPGQAFSWPGPARAGDAPATSASRHGG